MPVLPCDEFPFYINITNVCNAKCSFCSNACNKDYGKLDLNYLEEILEQISNNNYIQKNIRERFIILDNFGQLVNKKKLTKN